MQFPPGVALALSLLVGSCAVVAPGPGDELVFADDDPKSYRLSVRASKLDPRVRSYPKIDFLLTKNGQPQDVQHAAVDTSVAPRGKLVIWMMRYNKALFDRLNSYGLHAIQPHYANKWFSKVCREKPVGATCRGDMRLEAATGDDFSDAASIQKPDGMMERARHLVQWLAKTNPAGRWDYFLTADGSGLRWEHVIMAGSSHGSTTSARFAKHQKVSRVVMLCGPRDQLQTWQSLPSATPPNRYFGFSHVLDGGWTADHYCRSWELIGMHAFGPIVNVEATTPPYGNSRRLLTAADVKNDARRAHSSVQPGRSSPKDADGRFRFEPVWRYLFTHPVDEVGERSEPDPSCRKVHR